MLELQSVLTSPFLPSLPRQCKAFKAATPPPLKTGHRTASVTDPTTAQLPAKKLAIHQNDGVFLPVSPLAAGLRGAQAWDEPTCRHLDCPS